MNKIKNSFYGAKTHFKMYKKGRQWLVAGVTVMSIGLGVLGLNTVSASAETAETPIAAQTTEQTTADTPAPTNTEQPTTDQASTPAPQADATTPVTTNLGDATAQEVEAAKTSAMAAYKKTGDSQVITATAADESNQNVTVNFNSTIQTDQEQIVSSKKFTNDFNFSVDENNRIQSENSKTYGSLTDMIPNGYKLEKIDVVGKSNSGDVAKLSYDVTTGHATSTVAIDDTPAEIDQEVKAVLTNGVVRFDGNQFTIEYDDFDSAQYGSATSKLGSLINDIYTNYDFTFIVTDTAQNKTVTQPYQTVVKTTDGNVLNSQNAVNTYVVRASDDGSILSPITIDSQDLTDAIPSGYHLTGIQIVDTTNVDKTVMTVTYDPSTGVGNVVVTSVDPTTGQTVVNDYSKNPANSVAAVSAMALQAIKQMISPDPTANGTQYTASFKNLVNKDTLLNMNVNQQSTNTVITYIVAGQPNNPSGNNDNQGATNSASENNSTSTTNPNPEPTTDDNSVTSSDANTETTTAPSTATNDNANTDAQSNASDNSTATSRGNNQIKNLSNATNGGTAVKTTTDANQVAGSKTNGQTETGTLPQTNEDSASQASALLGLGLLASFAGLFGISRRKKEQQ
ncbi:KxYKxGKxW signal peptide domain-containing protein [Secundilactobacillus mixtipabuli]|uniref:Gram-positive cocci surface proteins LPxTG domain-containing protein n=1 Tax=Secundilactobacillus mixtipabuli TaxID=1435342 RepID=A0A1Z5ICD1_9LACO|nr:KxYKxGKxW signal peptide domain-containing protein [Secundilactobacillus mixtipabuli]GAW99308.1 hypothetical protein IWT30_01277 [Secundilactobacillus mixtipabuli]